MTTTTSQRRSSPVRFSLMAGVAAFLFGLALHFLAVLLRDYGPAWDGISLRGNGAIVVLVLAPIALAVGEVWCVRQHAWLGAALVPVGILMGLFIVAGGV